MQGRHLRPFVSFLIIAAAVGEAGEQEPSSYRSRLSCCHLEINGTAQGGVVSVGFTRSREAPISVVTKAGETANQVADKLLRLLKKEDEDFAELTKGNTLLVYNVGNGDLYLKSTDPGIRSGWAIEDLRAKSDPANSTALLTWRLPDVKPDAIYVFNSAGEAKNIVKDATQYSYAYPKSKGWGCWFYVVCGYFSADRMRITRYSDLRQVWVDNPHQMATQDLKIVVDSNSLPFPLGREDGYGLTKLGGVNPCVWSIAKGTLPSGLRMDAEGRISGTARKLGLHVVTVRLRDATGKEVAADVEVEVFNIPLYKKPKD